MVQEGHRIVGAGVLLVSASSLSPTLSMLCCPAIAPARQAVSNHLFLQLRSGFAVDSWQTPEALYHDEQASACVVVFAKDARGTIKTYAHRLVTQHSGTSMVPLIVNPESLQVRLAA